MGRKFQAFLMAAAICLCAVAGATTITVQADKPGPRINPAMWGIFFEDINFGADGGLYAELVKNRSFEFPDPLMGWHKLELGQGRGELAIRDQDPFDLANAHYLRLTATTDFGFGVSNEGFRGIGIRQGETYQFSVEIRSAERAPAALRIELR